MAYMVGTEVFICSNVGETANIIAEKTSYLFKDFTAMTEVANADKLNTSNVTSMSSMFNNCSNLTTLDVSNWDTNKVTSMSSMFYYCRSLTALDVSNWDTSNVTNMSSMFNNCSNLTILDVSNWDTGKATSMSSMFASCKELIEIDVSNWNTSKVTSMNSMFLNCDKIELLDLSNWDTRSIAAAEQNHGLNRLASSCNKLTTIILGENFGQVETIPPYVGYIDIYTAGMFNIAYSTTPTIVIGANDAMKAYDWAGDYRPATHFDSLYFSIDGHKYDFDYGMTLGEWCDSEYNPGEYWVNAYDFYYGDYEYVAWEMNENYVISPGEEIYMDIWCCFEAGTQVTISLNGDTLPIEALKEGDFIVSYNVETGENYLTKVNKLITNPRSYSMAKVYFDNGTILTMTDYHPLYTLEGFKSITDRKYSELKVGDILPTFDNKETIITNIELYKNESPITTYTLNVIDLDENIDNDTTDNYYANGIIVHNGTTCGFEQ